MAHNPLKEKAPLKTVEPRPCTGCGRCVKSCAFLKANGTPKEVLAKAMETPEQAFHCSLCGLCTAICREGSDPARAFLNIRRNAVARKEVSLAPYKSLLFYERVGVSKPFTWAHLPQGCKTVFFPGCGLSGTRPTKAMAAWEYLKQGDPTTGMVLDCCTKPSHDLGRQEAFEHAFGGLHSWLLSRGVERVVVACPNCFKVFSAYGTGVETVSIYEVMADDRTLKPLHLKGSHYLHHPCATRFEASVQEAASRLLLRSGAMPKGDSADGHHTLCCGEGGAVESVCAGYPRGWREKISERRGESRAITYCTGCASRVGNQNGASHLLDIYFHDGKGLHKASTSPRTYVNRLMLKRKLKGFGGEAITDGRHFRQPLVKLGAGVMLLAVMLMAYLGGAGEWLRPETLGAWTDGLGVAGPLLYIAVYWIACCLLLPGAPLTMGAAILFGPWLGLLVAVAGSVGGAIFAFLISRYLAAQWVKDRISGTPLEKLDARLEGESGWKVVGFLRLVPLFPFSLVNMALGVTRVRLFPYALTTLLAMFPATVAVILFSASLLDLLKGRPGISLVAGGLMVAAVSGLSFWLKRRHLRSL